MTRDDAVKIGATWMQSHMPDGWGEFGALPVSDWEEDAAGFLNAIGFDKMQPSCELCGSEDEGQAWICGACWNKAIDERATGSQSSEHTEGTTGSHSSEDE